MTVNYESSGGSARIVVGTPRGHFTVRRTGSGENYVLMMHPLALSGDVWTPLAAFLARDLTVLALDARGHGESEWDANPFTVEDMALDAAAVIEEVVGGPVAVGGMSMGGCTAIGLALARPELVTRLVLADTTSCYGPDRIAAWSERARKAVDTPRLEQLPFQINRWFTDPFVATNPAEVQRVADIFLATNSRVHAAACQAMGAFDATAQLGMIRAKTLVVVGEEDYATPPAMAKTLAAGIPDAHLEILHARHLSLVESAVDWGRVREYLSAAGE